MTGRLVRTTVPVVLLLANLFLYNVFAVYLGNAEEFSLPLGVLSLQFLPFVLVAMALLVAVAMVLPEKIHVRSVAILFALAALLYLQGNVLVWHYGLLDGTTMDLAQGSWRGLLDGTIWLAVILFALFRPRVLYRISFPAAILLLLLQGTFLLFASLRSPAIWSDSEGQAGQFPPDEIYEFSREGNLIHVVLDAFQSDIFEEIVNGTPDVYRGGLEGFTFYRNTLSDFPNTLLSIPSFLSGRQYRNEEPMRNYAKKVLGGKTVTSAAQDEGIEVDLVVAKRIYALGRYTNIYNIPFSYADLANSTNVELALLANLVLFRSVPHFFKPYVYRDQQWLFRSSDKDQNISRMAPFALMRVSHKELFESLIERANVSDRGYTYKLIHIHIPHPQIVFNDSCQVTGVVYKLTRESYSVQARCTLDLFMGFLDKLRTLGLYDTSTIVVHADHGQGFALRMTGTAGESGAPHPRFAGRNSALLAIKLPGQKGDLTNSEAPVMISDIPATVASLLQLTPTFPGRSILDLQAGEGRKRKTYSYNWSKKTQESEYLFDMVEWTVDDNLFDRKSWSKTGLLPPPAAAR